MKIAIRLLALALVAAVGLGGYVWAGVTYGWFGELETAGAPQATPAPAAEVAARAARQVEAAAALGVDAARPAARPAAKQILFGDMHVHTTFSPDAFLWSLPMMSGDGAHPLADACDFARHCSALDFWGITDHAEASTPRKWAATKDAVRQCNAIAGDPANPDLVTFLGFEWTQVGRTPDEHYGHKNVHFKGLADDEVSARAIASEGAAIQALRRTSLMPPGVAFVDWSRRQRYFDFQAFSQEVQAAPLCDRETPSNELPTNCVEVAATPADLTERLDAQGHDYLLIPHGTTWGYYTPPGTSFDKQLKAEMRPERQELFEIYSGHGNSEEYRNWRAATLKRDEDGAWIGVCPQPGPDYAPACWRAGEIIEERCLTKGGAAADCAKSAQVARDHASNMSIAYHLAVKGESPEDWLDSGQCVDCFLPSFNYRPAISAQYGLAISNFDDGVDRPRRFHWGFIASSDNHRARPGTGYKEVGRRLNTEASGADSPDWRERLNPTEAKSPATEFIGRAELARAAGFGLLETERQNSFWLTGGLAAVHAEGRSREQIWDAMKRRETYGTSGPRILLWFDLVDGAERAPMGAAVVRDAAPEFEVRAVGSFKQRPGCPDHAANGLGAERLQHLCRGECYNPSSERHPITRIEVVRIRPQIRPDEPVEALIEDPWKVLACPASQSGCRVRFSDPDYAAGGRDATYYVRAIQEETEAINADPLRCERDASGACVKVTLCHGDYRGGDDDCLAPVEERAWSSPIYVRWPQR